MFVRLLNRLLDRKSRRRERILLQPFPEPRLRVLRRSVPAYARLSGDQQRHLRECVQVFIAEKHFLGCAGIEITEEIRGTIAAGACVLLLGLPHVDVFPRLREIIVYPHDRTDTVEAIGPDGRPYEIRTARAGEAWRRGPVVLAWDSVRRSVGSPGDGYNVVYHEFAHVLDMQNGSADGIPPLDSPALHEKWMAVFFREFDAFVEETQRGRGTFIDPYGASHPSEFFAVATEHFFEQPGRLRRNHAALYDLFSAFYRQDPARWRPSS